MSEPSEHSVGDGRRRTYTPQEIRALLDRCELPSTDVLALATAELSHDALQVVGRYFEELASRYERLAEDAERAAQ